MKQPKKVFHLFCRGRPQGDAARARSKHYAPRFAQRSVYSAVILLLMLSSAFAKSDGLFARANQEYAANDFKDAISDYKAVADSGKCSANLFYDLGNAYFRAGDLGHSILNYERALVMERHHPEARANLTLVRDESRALELTPNRVDQLLQFATANQYAIAAAVALWIGVFSIAKLVFATRRSGAVIALTILSLAIFAAAIFAVYWLEMSSHGRQLAIVTGDDVEARLATAESSGAVLALPPGSEIQILRRRGDWIYAALPNDLRGWIPEKSAEPVRL